MVSDVACNTNQPLVVYGHLWAKDIRPLIWNRNDPTEAAASFCK